MSPSISQCARRSVEAQVYDERGVGTGTVLVLDIVGRWGWGYIRDHLTSRIWGWTRIGVGYLDEVLVVERGNWYD